MTKPQEDFFAMALKVKSFYAKNHSAMTVVPVLADYYDELNVQIETLIAAHSGSLANLTGVALHKMQKRQELQSLAHRISGAVSVYGVVNHDAELQKRSNIRLSFWQSCNEKALVTHATVIKGLALPLAASLVPYGVSEAEVFGLDSSIASFVDVMFSPALALKNRKGDTQKVASGINEIRTFLKEKLDVMMRSMEVSNKEVYDLYLSARAIDR
jgi:hypothetical protein